MLALMVTASVGYSVAASVIALVALGAFALLRKPEVAPHDPELEYRKLVARLRAGVIVSFTKPSMGGRTDGRGH